MIKFNNLSVEFPVLDNDSGYLVKKLFSLNKIKNKKEIITALSNIDIKIDDGDRVGIYGHNGSGKSTLLRVISGVITPSKGNFDINGNVSSLINIASGIYMDGTGIENIYFRSTLMGIEKKVIDKKIDEIISFADIKNFINYPIKTYSSGMLMRLLFSIVTAYNHEIIVMDEFISTGDAKFIVKANDRIHKMIHNSNNFIFASHSLDLITKFCNRMIILYGGEIVFYGRTDVGVNLINEQIN
jgi:lipopolysaccharide transport system ATP-binding protein